MEQPAVSVVVPCANGEAHVAQTIRSLTEQTRRDFELLLVDDASRDGSIEVARAAASGRLRVVRNERPLGLAANWNRALALARAELVLLAHQDDVYEASFLERMVPALEAAPRAAFAHCPARTIDDEGRPVRSPVETYKRAFWRGLARLDRGALFGRLLRGNFVCCPSILYRKSAHERLGGFREDLSFCADWDYALRAVLAGFELVHVPETLIAYRRHRTNTTRAEIASLNRYREELEVLRAAAAAGARAGLRAPGPPPLEAVRNNLLFDAFMDLRAGDSAAARAKLDFGAAEIEGFARDPIARAFRLALRLGPAGRLLLAAGLRLRLALGPAGLA